VLHQKFDGGCLAFVRGPQERSRDAQGFLGFHIGVKVKEHLNRVCFASVRCLGWSQGLRRLMLERSECSVLAGLPLHFCAGVWPNVWHCSGRLCGIQFTPDSPRRSGMRNDRITRLSMFVMVCFPYAVMADVKYTFATIDDPAAGPFGTEATGINNAGQIVGHYFDNFGNFHAFLDSGGSFSNINSPFPVFGPTGINDRDQIVGTTNSSSSLLDTAGTFTMIMFLGLPTFANGINNAGQVVGYTGAFGFIEKGGVFTTFSAPSGNTHAFGINNSEQIVGYASAGVEGLGQEAFLYSSGVFRAIDPPGATNSAASGINDRGEIVGNYGDSTGGHAFIYIDGGFSVITVPDELGPPVLTGVNDSGQIVGIYSDAAGRSHGFVATPVSSVPEPRTLPVLLGLVATLLAMACARNRVWARK
jgi:uncharacterized membrane protein